ncbi:MAG: SecE/Sec61-gamma subunit of protein translocation complex [Planctomycetota bacterium]|jgi:preprotein translocase subunit SecE
MAVMARFREFLKDVRVEAGKVSWPTRDELRDSTIVVIITTLLVAAFIGVVDQILLQIRDFVF